jgi:hypothetical protein
MCATLCPPHSPWFDVPNYIWGWVQIKRLHIVQLHPLSCYYAPLRSRLYTMLVFLCQSLLQHLFDIKSRTTINNAVLGCNSLLPVTEAKYSF